MTKWTAEHRANHRKAMALTRKQNKDNTISGDIDVPDAMKSLGRFIAPQPITTLTFKALLFQLKRKRAFLNQAISSLEELVKEEDAK